MIISEEQQKEDKECINAYFAMVHEEDHDSYEESAHKLTIAQDYLIAIYPHLEDYTRCNYISKLEKILRHAQYRREIEKDKLREQQIEFDIIEKYEELQRKKIKIETRNQYEDDKEELSDKVKAIIKSIIKGFAVISVILIIIIYIIGLVTTLSFLGDCLFS